MESKITQQYHYLVVDDDTTNNLICDYTIKRYNRNAKVTLFTCPEEALDFLQSNNEVDSPEGTILFLDVNMPTMTGFEFLKEFENLAKKIKEHHLIYMLTSSIEDFSLQEKDFPRINGCLSKPLKLSHLEKIHQELYD